MLRLLLVAMGSDDPTGFARESWNPAPSAFAGAIHEVEEEEEGLVMLLLLLLWESRGGCLLQNSKSMPSSVLLPQVCVGLLFGGLICKDKSGCAGKSSILSLSLFLHLHRLVW